MGEQRMKAMVWGVGLQGKAVIHDLEHSALVNEIIAADVATAPIQQFIAEKGYRKTRAQKLDASRENELNQMVGECGADVLICMLPPPLAFSVARAALKSGMPYVSSNYTDRLTELDYEAREKGVVILPEMGMDPGIDLVLGRLTVDALDEVHGFYSYGGGIPEPACAGDNPVHYKITWTFDGVLKSYKRPARFLKAGKEHAVPGTEIYHKENVHLIQNPTLGTLEACLNGDAVRYIREFGLDRTVTDMGRFSLRWPGHARLWRNLSDLGFLDDTPLKVGEANLSPHQFMVYHLTPRLQYRQNERDVVIIRTQAWGLKDGKKLTVTFDLIDYRDLQTGLFAMNRTVGFTASIGAQMILQGKIQKAGVLSPARHVPPHDLVKALESRGMQIDQRIDEAEDRGS
jgi:saccharopine dehydrogenase-like NADP-dependent oxidoreductase